MSADGDESVIYQGRASWKLRLAQLGLLATLCGWLVPVHPQMPESGVLVGRMCVTPLDPRRGAGDCGQVDILLLGKRHANVRIADVVYRLELDRGRIDVILMQGTMQIDGFTTAYEWQGTALHFDDLEKGLRYRIHFDPAKAAPR